MDALGHPPPQSEADELVPAGLQEVLDVFLPAQTHPADVNGSVWDVLVSLLEDKPKGGGGQLHH